MSDLPKWVYDVVIALQQHEDEHGDATSCLAPVLALVPPEVGHDADAIRRYTAMTQGDERTREQGTGLADGLAAEKGVAL